jgi:hypothetical protein
MTDVTLAVSTKYYLSQIRNPYLLEPGKPVYDAALFHIIIPELLRRVQTKSCEGQEMTTLDTDVHAYRISYLLKTLKEDPIEILIKWLSSQIESLEQEIDNVESGTVDPPLFFPVEEKKAALTIYKNLLSELETYVLEKS